MVSHIRFIQKRDPANPTFMEVVLGYNGFHALLFYKLARFLRRYHFMALGRFISNLGRILTGIEIHPDATIGKNLFIDHGTGVVIGQTAIVGDNVTIYHGVTLGGVGREGEEGKKRHPTIEDGVIIGAGAQILGDITIGKNAKIGANSVVTINVPEGLTALGVPARIIGGDGKNRAYGLPSRAEMETVYEQLHCAFKEIEALKEDIKH